MSRIDSARGRLALIAGHVAGMVDMVALPVWVGTLIQHYGFDPQQAGGLVTIFLLGVVTASMLLAPLFEGMSRRYMAVLGYFVAAMAFLAASQARGFAPLAVAHLFAGLGLGCGLSLTHGTIGRSANPHRLFAWAQFAVGVFAVGFFIAVPRLIAGQGGSSLFLVFAALMFIAVMVMIWAFPDGEERRIVAAVTARKIQAAVWFAIAGVLLLTLNQAMMFSFLERVGVDRGFGVERVNTVLVVVGFVNLFPALLAAALQRLVSPRTVALLAPLAQAALAVVITQAESFEPYAAAGSVYVFVMIFAHTFLFGLIARLDPSGRAVASTPAMVMAGSAIGPFLGGTLVVVFGYPALGIAACVIAALAVLCVFRIREAPHSPVAAATAAF